MLVIGKNIKSLREKQELTQEQVSLVTGISRESISYYENGTRPVPVKFLELFANLFNVEIEQLLEENPEEMRLFTSFRSINSSDEDLIQVAAFKQIIRNYLKLKALSGE
jgi:transcriptional regulator with XRE-family HTH domain